MEGISRKDLDEICEILEMGKYSTSIKHAKELSKKLNDYDIIPKLYAYTYFKKVFAELKLLRGDGKSIDIDELQQLAENNGKLQLGFINTSTEANKLAMFLSQGFDREDKFCDFDDSKFHDKTKIGSCQAEDHVESVDEPIIPLTAEEQKDFDMIKDDKGFYEAQLKYASKFNPGNQELTPVYFADEESHKYNDEPQWICKLCADSLDGGDCDVSVSCDMEDDL